MIPFLLALIIVQLIVIIILGRQCRDDQLEKIKLKEQFIFTNKVPRRLYFEMMYAIKSKKGRLSKQSKEEILNYAGMLLALMPKDLNINIMRAPKDFDELTSKDHKKQALDLLYMLSRLDDYNSTCKMEINNLYYHLVQIVLKK